MLIQQFFAGHCKPLEKILYFSIVCTEIRFRLIKESLLRLNTFICCLHSSVFVIHTAFRKLLKVDQTIRLRFVDLFKCIYPFINLYINVLFSQICIPLSFSVNTDITFTWWKKLHQSLVLTVLNNMSMNSPSCSSEPVMVFDDLGLPKCPYSWTVEH